MFEFYPNEPGAKGLTAITYGTSAGAAASIASRVSHLRRVALDVISAGEGTVLELVARTDCTRETLQPRFSELITCGLVEPTGARRRNPSGKSAAVLRITHSGRALLAGSAT